MPILAKLALLLTLVWSSLAQAYTYNLGAFWRPNAVQLTLQTPMTDGTKVGALDTAAFTMGGSCPSNGQQVSLSGAVTTQTPCAANAWSIALNLSAQAEGLFSITATQPGSPSVTRWLVKETTYCANSTNANAVPFAGGDGSAETPYLICTQAQLNQVRNHLTSNFLLKNHVDLSASPNGFAPIGGGSVNWWDNPTFKGIFDGGGFEIRGFRYDTHPTYAGVALFGAIESATIRNLGLVDFTVAGAGPAAGLVGKLWHDSVVEDCWVKGSLTVGDINGGENGLLVGAAGGGVAFYDNLIRRSFALGTIDNTLDAEEVGGLVGWMRTSSIEDSWAQASITGTGGWVGGLIGAVSSDAGPSLILHSYATGAVAGNTAVGGLVGERYESDLTVTSSYWDTQKSGQASSDGGTGKTSAEMASQSTFVGWDFVNRWIMPASAGLTSGPPVLRGRICTGTESSYQDHGSGTPASPYVLCNVTQLLQVMAAPTSWSKAFRLGADIDLSGYNQSNGIAPIGRRYSGSVITPFVGVFDGDGHVISNYSYSSSAAGFVSGLFGYVQGPGRIENLGMTSVSLVDGGNASVSAPLVGWLDFGGVVDHCYATGTLTSTATNYAFEGGLVGAATPGSLISASHSSVSITATGIVESGGLVGSAENTTIRDSYAQGSIDCGTSVSSSCGGLVGWMEQGTRTVISRSFATGNITGSAGCAAGLVGGDTDAYTLVDSFATGNASGNANTWPNVGPLNGCGLGGFNDSNSYFSSTAIFTNPGSGSTNTAGLSADTGADPAYFKNPVHAPLNAWDFNLLWRDNNAEGRLPGLRPNGATASCSGTETSYRAHGKGTPGNPYRICTRAQLLSLMATGSDMDKAYRLENDIELLTYNETNGIKPIGSLAGDETFSGIFDGNGYSIRHLTYTANGKTGLFATLDNGAIVKNLNLPNVSLTLLDNSDAGAIAAGAGHATIAHCTASGTVSASVAGADPGGLVGWACGDNGVGPHLINVSSAVNVSNPAGVAGGLTATTADCSSLISDSSSTGILSSKSRIGGLVGERWGGALVIRRSYSSSPISAGTNGAAGGLVGRSVNAGGGLTIEDSFATGNVVCSAANGNGAMGACGTMLGAVDSNVSGTAWYYSGATLSNDGGFGTNNSGWAGLTVAFQGSLSWFYDPAHAPLSAWDFYSLWQSNFGPGALPSLK